MRVKPRVVEFAFLADLSVLLGLAELHDPFEVLCPAILLALLIDFEFFLLTHVDNVALVIGNAALGVHENFEWRLLP